MHNEEHAALQATLQKTSANVHNENWKWTWFQIFPSPSPSPSPAKMDISRDSSPSRTRLLQVCCPDYNSLEINSGIPNQPRDAFMQYVMTWLILQNTPSPPSHRRTATRR